MYGTEKQSHISLKWIIIIIVLVISIIVILLFSGLNSINSSNKLSFSQNEYSFCIDEVLETEIIIPKNNKDLIIKSIESSDVNIATVDDKTTYQPNSLGNRISCLKS